MIKEVRVLAVNKFFYLRGGCERYFFALEELLKTMGHEVRHLSMKHPRNRPSPDLKYFVSEVDFSRNESLGRSIEKGLRVIYSPQAKRAMEAVLRDTAPDIVHLHNIAHQLSPSILLPLKNGGPPVVQTMHDYKLVCPIYVLARNGRTCEDCRGGRYYNVAVKGCHPGGFGAAVANAAEMYLHRSILKSYDAVDIFICPSNAMLEKMLSFGIPENRLAHVPHFIPVEEYSPRSGPKDYYVYAGRLSREKGLLTLMEAAASVPDMKLLVLGEGPLEEELKTRFGSKPWIELGGYLHGDELMDALAGAAFSVLPSQCYENSPLAVMESFALGVPVVASRIGGLPEMVTGGETGLLVRPGDAEDLASAISWLAANPKETERMGAVARRFAEREYSADAHYGRLMEVYGRALS